MIRITNTPNRKAMTEGWPTVLVTNQRFNEVTLREIEDWLNDHDRLGFWWAGRGHHGIVYFLSDDDAAIEFKIKWA